MTSQYPGQRLQRELRTELQLRSTVVPRLELPLGRLAVPLDLPNFEAIEMCSRGQQDTTLVLHAEPWVDTMFAP